MLTGDGEVGRRVRVQSKDTPCPKEVVTEDFTTTSSLGPDLASAGEGGSLMEKDSLWPVKWKRGLLPAFPPHGLGAGSLGREVKAL